MKWLRLPAVFILLIICFMIALVGVALIPKDTIRENVRKSAELMCEKEVFYDVIEDIEGSRIDRYADSILLGIAWQYDKDQPLNSVMESSYYHTMFKEENENLLEAVREDRTANQQYIRYWHGSIVVVRLLLTIISVKGIYILNGICLLLLSAVLVIMLIKKKAIMPAIGIITGMILTSSWFVPLSLEYTWMYLLTMIFTIVILLIAGKGRKDWYTAAFLAFGMITSFFDFLTTETMTLTIPLLFLVWADRTHNGTDQSEFISERAESESQNVKTQNQKSNIIKSKNQKSKNINPNHMTKKSPRFKALIKAYKPALSWGIGYVAAWVSKWLLASLVLGENVMPYVSSHIAERIGGRAGLPFGPIEYLFRAVFENIKCIFPFEYGIIGMLSGVMLVILYVYLAYVYRDKDFDKRQIAIYLMIAAIPYVRYLVLHNHSYQHYFFTYRAQFATILALVLILDELKVGAYFRRKYGHRR